MTIDSQNWEATTPLTYAKLHMPHRHKPAAGEPMNTTDHPDSQADVRDELAELRQRLTALAEDFDQRFRTAGNCEKPGSQAYEREISNGLIYRRASLRLRDVLAGYEGSLYYGAMPWLRDRVDTTGPADSQDW